MQRRKSTRMVLHEDLPTAITSSHSRANLDTVGFNIGFLLRRRPLLAVEVLKLYDQACGVREEDPDAPEEDTRQAAEEWTRFAVDAADDLS
jgi:hypothetical protein